MTDPPTDWPQEGTPPPPTGPLRDGPAWEQREGILDLGALFTTVKDVLIDAPRTFATMNRDNGLGGPLVYLLILGTISGWVGQIWGFLLEQAVGSFGFGGGTPDFSQFGFPQNQAVAAFMATSLFKIISALMLPAIILVVFFIEAGVFHLMLLIVGGARQSFETTARVVAYASGATALFQMVPFCGGLIGFVWGIIVTILGLAYAHETSTGRAVAAVLLPLVLCCLCCVLVVAFLIATAAQLSGANL
jgi:hypothetical protein